MRKYISILILAILISSCHSKQAENESYDVTKKEEAVNSASQQSAIEPSPIDKIDKQEPRRKKIIKDGRLGIRVTELEKTKLRIDSLVKNHGAYYANESFNNTDWESSFIMKIRIPCENFERFLYQIESGKGEMKFKEIDAKDVTDQFIDLETRLENKRNYLKRYTDLLKQAKNINEILEIEEKIRVLEEEIESTTGRLKYMSDLVDYSTLDLTITKDKEFKFNPVNRDKFYEKLKQSLSRGWFGFVDFFLFLINIWPLWIIAILFLYFWKRYKKSKIRK
ncbi:MAG: DUF4349 domain-containing protein [Bacteroidales bacterium]|nr:DUF4349 domain-containing protein [Bacteroidales bacterium]